MNPIKAIGLAFGLIVLLFLGLFIGRIGENVSSQELVVIQAPFTGKLTWYKSPGFAPQWFGTVTTYPKQMTYEFEDEVRFNDGGHGTLIGSVQWTMPLDEKHLNDLHMKFGSAEAIQRLLVQKVVDKSVYMTGPLMSSKESYAEKRNYLISWVEDQIAHGVYRTVQREAKIPDPLTGVEKSVLIVDIVTEGGTPVRQEAAVLDSYGIVTSNFAIKKLPYDPQVEEQIKEQQKIAMQVQTAIAESRQAEQRTLTVEQQGKAAAAQAKWDQEVLKAKAVTEGEQKLAVATLDNQAAEQYRQATLKRADADAGYRRQVMQADGALQQKLQTIQAINQVWADAFANAKNPVVPSIVMGGGGTANGAASTQQLMELLTTKAAKDLAVELGR